MPVCEDISRDQMEESLQLGSGADEAMNEKSPFEVERFDIKQ